MATFHIDRDSNFTYNVTAPGHTYILDADVSLVNVAHPLIVEATAINTTLQIKGQLIAGGNAAGLLSVANGADITIERNGFVAGNYGVHIAGDSVTLTNRGLVEGLNYGVLVNAQVSQIENTGHIFGTQYGIMLGESSERQSFDLVNNGSIAAEVGISTSVASGMFYLGENSRVVGDDYGIRAFTQLGGTIEVENHGLLKGTEAAFNGWTGVDTFINYGTVRGHVFLEGGNDVFIERDGKVIGAVEGGLGDDTYTVLSTKTRVREIEGQGHDTILTAGNYSMEGRGEIEDLKLTGALNVSGFGNSYDNAITGNRGNNKLDGGDGEDVLTGGRGRDTFMFQSDLRTDYITDFENGVDKIRITGFEGYDSFDDLVLTRVGDNVEIDLVSGEFGEVIVVEGTRLRDLDASDFIFQ
jgi:Ca2+-binding RTX toxin-like protein